MEQSIEESLLALQAQMVVQGVALKALSRDHPNPAALLSAWNGARADAVAANYSLPPNDRHSSCLGDRIQAFAEEWTAELVELALAAGNGTGPPRT